MRSAYRVESAASDPPNPRLIARRPSSGNDSGRFQRTILEAPMKTMAFCGGDVSLSASSNFLIVGSQRFESFRSAAPRCVVEAAPVLCAATREDGTPYSAKAASRATPRRTPPNARFVIQVFYA